ncbi:MAG: NUDIX hydrolase [Beijerinckiaceae bacterium]|jgi:8-oxo-dGTP pyrophosphatase MutT (NUDIX family)|nr:NUDIX hydrolase [Beijerinckiaceae bacterium]
MPEGGAQILALDDLDMRLEARDWAFAAERRVEIETHWTAFLKAKPASFNGQVFLQHSWTIEAATYRGRYLQTDYASFLAWRDFGYPAPAMRNGFAMAALRARDGAFLLGRMGEGTANPGRIYFAAGTPDPDDLLPDGRIDLAGSVLREMAEETGLQASEVEVGRGWTAVIDGARAAFMRPVSIDLPAEAARALMLARMPHLPHPELSDIVIVRSVADIDAEAMPHFQQAFLRHAFGQAG